MSAPVIIVALALFALAAAGGWYGRGIYENLRGYDQLREADRREFREEQKLWRD